ncbi:hypothetical protein HU200_036110 [Digitaria exilis]|uniref:Uncharacterized protein n=1 Tax=Digitaria exilis TaxID=1010633 RepID=A0A835BGG0_9POAL|nr:hypothetical protein HU200_036110 [Digitaria exilis]
MAKRVSERMMESGTDGRGLGDQEPCRGCGEGPGRPGLHRGQGEKSTFVCGGGAAHLQFIACLLFAGSSAAEATVAGGQQGTPRLLPSCTPTFPHLVLAVDSPFPAASRALHASVPNAPQGSKANNMALWQMVISSRWILNAIVDRDITDMALDKDIERSPNSYRDVALHAAAAAAMHARRHSCGAHHAPTSSRERSIKPLVFPGASCPVGLPIINNAFTFFVLLRHNPHRALARLAETYGPIFIFCPGMTCTFLVLSSPAMAREALSENEAALVSPEPSLCGA